MKDSRTPSEKATCCKYSNLPRLIGAGLLIVGAVATLAVLLVFAIGNKIADGFGRILDGFFQ